MKKIIGYLVLLLIAGAFFMVWQHFVKLPTWYLENLLLAQCTLIGIIGGVMYCLRSVYLNKCVRKIWEQEWEVWYYLRPITSAISGFVSFIFLKAGLLVLNAVSKQDQISFGYLAIAFIAGYNVDNFMKKIEEVASSIWGIKKTKASQDISPESEKDEQD